MDANGYRRFHTPDGTYVTRYPEQPETTPARCGHRGSRTRSAVAGTGRWIDLILRFRFDRGNKER